MTGSRAAFADLDTAVCGSVRFGDDSVAEIEGRGTVLFSCKNGEHRSFTGVYYIPRLTANIVSLGQLEEADYDIHLQRGGMEIREPGGRLLATIPRAGNRLYVLDVNVARPVCLAARGEESAWRWHARLGHINMPALRKMAREEMVRGLPTIEQAQWRAERALELVHGDLCGPVTPATPSGNIYFLLLVDDRSRYMWLVLLPSKGRAAAAIKEFQARAEAESGCKLLALRTDRSGELTSKEFMEYCAADGVHRQLTAPYSPQQNSIVERRNAMVVGTARSLLKAKELPAWFWGEAVNTAVYLLNRVPTKAVEGKTPFEAWYGKKPAVHHLKTFGCIVYVKNTAPHLKKMEDCGRKMIFVGYERGSKAYRAYDPVAKRVHVTRDVWDYSGGDTTSTGTEQGGHDTFTVQYRMVPEQEGVEDTAPAMPDGGMELGTPSATAATAKAASPAALAEAASPAASAGAASPLIQFATPPATVDEDLDADHDDDVPLWFRTVENILSGGQLFAVSAEEPGTLAQAEQDPSWRRAMKEELRAIEENQTWTLTELPPGRRAIGLKWVFKVKKDEHGAVVRHKARLVVKGYAQRQGIDYDEVFAPVARMEAVRLLLALAAQEGWQVHHMDLKTAFLNGDLQVEVYVQQAPGFAQPEQEHKVYKLHKALYGLHQAPHAWNQKLDEQLGVLGFVKCPSEHAIYCRGRGAERLVVGVYVDDLVITGTSSSSIQKFKAEMTKVFKMSDLGLLSYYLGIEVRQEEVGISLCQGSYAGKILEKCGLEDCNSCKVPMDVKPKLSKESSSPTSLVGSLRYLVNTRPDLAFSVGYVSRFMKEPHQEHLAAVKQIVRYIAGTQNWGLFYARRNGGSDGLLGYSDSDVAGDVDGRKSTSGILFFLGESPISWQSAKQKVVALSSCEAEYIAAATGACQAVWLARLLAEIRDPAVRKPMLRVDNKSAISLIKNPVHHDRSKHIDIRFHLIREYAHSGQIEVKFISTQEQLGDILTKPLDKVKFQELCTKIDLRLIQ
ncbi:hypothetical protein U9M48_011722 [Paspalum notatum var. saurae]|uniref:Integrase catalytic domain-containing protein n=1 Tax=Paspalum notatum var. saurae TaxID=547442 RepID=A0AAQ3WHU1_PASNO